MITLSFAFLVSAGRSDNLLTSAVMGGFGTLWFMLSLGDP